MKFKKVLSRVAGQPAGETQEKEEDLTNSITQELGLVEQIGRHIQNPQAVLPPNVKIPGANRKKGKEIFEAQQLRV